jgi:hypothetical protein
MVVLLLSPFSGLYVVHRAGFDHRVSVNGGDARFNTMHHQVTNHGAAC